jgi:hypothetical protein
MSAAIEHTKEKEVSMFKNDCDLQLEHPPKLSQLINKLKRRPGIDTGMITTESYCQRLDNNREEVVNCSFLSNPECHVHKCDAGCL